MSSHDEEIALSKPMRRAWLGEDERSVVYRSGDVVMRETGPMMDELDRAIADGVDLTLDVYPYPCGSTMPVCRFPGWFVEGGPTAIMKRLADPADRRRVIEFLEESNGEALGHTSWTYIGSERNRHLEGMSWTDVAADRGTSVAEMMCDVLLEENLECGLTVLPPQSVAVWR
jgi:N-acyl-D-amino-acid deacylase